MAIIHYMKEQCNPLFKYIHTHLYMYNAEQKYVRLYTKTLIVVILWGIECGSFYFLLFHFFVVFFFILANKHVYSFV